MKSNNQNDVASVLLTITRLMRECVAGSGMMDSVSVVQLKVLAVVEETENPTMKDIAGRLYITSPSATAIINRLVAAKKISRIYDKKDRRIVRLKMTQKGKKEFFKCRKEITKKINNRVAVLNKKEQAVLVALMQKVINSK